jgi:C4-dicarboxylate-specific signal transduction histidine kinase
VLLVLLENAQNILTLRGIKNPEINISLDQIDKEVIIKVSDNAGGILIEPVSSIFEPFVTDQEQGTGRGLFIAKMIIEKNLKGNITARNDKNGAVFTIAYCTE